MNYPKKALTVSLLTLFCLLNTNTSQTCKESAKQDTITHLLCDLNGVFFDTSRFGMMQEVGLWNCIRYLFTGGNPKNIKKILFNFLDKLSGPQKESMQDDNGPIMADGLPMPELMRRWKSGETTGLEVIKEVNAALAEETHSTFFSGWVEKQLVKNILNAVFNPALLSRHTHPIKAGVEILRDCAKNKKLELLVLSNYAHDAFEALSSKKESRQVFRHFKPENIVISGDIGWMKPNKQAFDYMIEKYNLDPKSCVFIDDHKNNTDAAKKLGFKTILVENGDFSAVRKQLIAFGILDK